ncbi:MAG: molybdopterin-guanine dinucleotide biosynthesis protein B [Gemmatimonadetes bacterium]|nr:molybdopterin-guanine dinucleotide biosynthesis protein B [Gemmatimonadota bacterium]
MSARTGGHERPLLGVVLAGGESRRFGSPKALATLHAKPLWQVAVGRLGAVCDRVEVSANDPVVAGAVRSTAAVFADSEPNAGPLGGLHAARRRAVEVGAGGIMVLAVDTPWVPREALVRLVEQWRSHGRACVAATGSPWGFEPLTAVYPVASLDSLEDALRGGHRQAGAFAESLNPVVVDTGVASARFRSVNRPEDLPPPAFSIVGNKNSGKTTLTVAVIAELARRGRRVMSVKHGHHFRLDTPGTDSWRHRHEGGAERVLLAGPDEFAVMGGWETGSEPPLDLLLSRHLVDAEIVVVEGYRHEELPRVEIFRSTAQPEPALGPEAVREWGILAVVTDRGDLGWSASVLDPDAADTAVRVADAAEEALL